MLGFIILAIIAYCAGGEWWDIFKWGCAIGFIACLCSELNKITVKKKESRASRRNDRELKKAQKELRKAIAEIRAASKTADSAVKQCKEVEVSYRTSDNEINTSARYREAPAEPFDPDSIDIKELSIEQLQKRLNALYSRMDRYHYINSAPEDWEKFKKSKTYRGLDFDINDTEERLERAINREKARWANA